MASGRDADIFEYGPGLVLRRARQGRSLEYEARVMEYARAHGYPVPAVEEISSDGTELVMERITGRSMMDVLVKRPWALARQGAVLADLHHRLHAIAGPQWLRPAPGAPGNRLLHLDLHPLNVMLSPTGPVVIDWTGASRGEPDSDVAVTWMLMAIGAIPTGRVTAFVVERARRLAVDSFVKHFDRGAVARQIRTVVEWKVNDPHMSAAEITAMWRLVETTSGAP